MSMQLLQSVKRKTKLFINLLYYIVISKAHWALSQILMLFSWKEGRASHVIEIYLTLQHKAQLEMAMSSVWCYHHDTLVTFHFLDYELRLLVTTELSFARHK